MKKYLLLLLLILTLPLSAFAQRQSGPSKFIPRYFTIENTAEYPEYLFFSVTWDLEPELIIIDSDQKFIGGKNTVSQVTIYYGKKEKFTEALLKEKIKDFQAFHEIKNLNKFSYPIKLSFWEIAANSNTIKTTNYLRIKDLNKLKQTEQNKEYLVLEDAKLVITDANGSEEVKNLLINTNTETKKRLDPELAIFVSIAMPLLLLWILWLIYNKFRKKK